MTAPSPRERLEQLLSRRILVIDGAMGTSLQDAELYVAEPRWDDRTLILRIGLW